MDRVEKRYKIQMLIANKKSWLLIEKKKDRYGSVCRPCEVGQLLLNFANEDLSDIQWIAQIVDIMTDRLRENMDESGCLRDSVPLQNLALNVIAKLDDKRPKCGGLFNAAVQKILDFEAALPNEMLFWHQSLIQKEIKNTFSDLQAIPAFQRSIREALSKVTMAGRAVTDDAMDTQRLGNEQLLWRVLQDFPELNDLCTGVSGFTVFDVDGEGELREEMLDLPLTKAFRLVLNPGEGALRKDSIQCKKEIGEYHEITDIRRIILIDMIEALRLDIHFSRCETCGKFFIPKGRRYKYCGNPACSAGRERMNNYLRRNKSDLYLKQAYTYKNTMCARQERTINPPRTDFRTQKQPARIKPLSDSEYDAWMRMFHDEVERYKNEKARAILRDDRDKIIEEAGRRLLEKTCPQDYVSKKRRKEESR